MKIYKSKVDIFNTITRYLGFSKIIITGSTALKMWELTTESNELDLDLIIYDIMPESWQKLLSLHELFGVEKQVVYPNSDKTTREVGTLVSLSFPTAKGDCLVHIFCMEKAKMTKMKREPFEMFVSGYKFYVNHPMNIIEAKKSHSREKGFKQLWNMAANLIKPNPEPEDRGCATNLNTNIDEKEANG